MSVNISPSNVSTSAGMRELVVYSDYEAAQRAVDYLSDQRFAVGNVRIIGHGVTTVEAVAGRMTKGRAALSGAAGGAWLGLLIGVLFGLFTPGVIWLSLIVAGLFFGALWGAAFGFIGHWATRGKRDFASARFIAAESYSLMVNPDHFAEAERLLADLR